MILWKRNRRPSVRGLRWIDRRGVLTHQSGTCHCHVTWCIISLKSHWAQLWIDDCSSGAKEQWLMCCLCQKTSYLTHVFSMLYWALKKALILGLETRKKYENFRNFVRIHITKPHVIKCFTLFKMKEKLTQRFSKKITGIFDHLQAFPLSPLDTKMLQKHNRSVLYLMKNE